MKINYPLTIVLVITFNLTVWSQPTVTLDNTILIENEVAVGLNVPWEMLWGPDDHIWYTERRGRVFRLDPDSGQSTEVLNISEVYAFGEAGMLGMVLHPDFEENPYVYLVYTYGSAWDIFEKLVRYTWDGEKLTGGQTILDDIVGETIHDGSRLLITEDLKLIMTTGEVGEGSYAQDLDRLNGKILRMNLDGTIPDDNPFENSYVYSFGHRNPQGLAFGPNGILYSSEHGPNHSDELNIIEAGRNYGWPNVTGICNTNAETDFCDENAVVEPIKFYTPCVAVSDLFYYQHDAIPEWNGKMIMAVLGGFIQRPSIRVIELDNDGNYVDEEEYFKDYGRLRDICINPHTGSLYFATNGTSYPSNGPNKIIEYKVNGTVSTTDNRTPQLSIAPNPITLGGDIHLTGLDAFIGGRVTIYAYDGTQVDHSEITRTSLTFCSDGLSTGNYFVRAEYGNTFASSSLIVVE